MWSTAERGLSNAQIYNGTFRYFIDCFGVFSVSGSTVDAKPNFLCTNNHPVSGWAIKDILHLLHTLPNQNGQALLGLPVFYIS